MPGSGPNGAYDSTVPADLAAVQAQLGVGASTAYAPLMQKLRQGIESAVAIILGDSTCLVGTTPWPRQVADWLATQFPAYTVLYRVFNTTNQNYDAAVTVQTGNGTGNAGGPFTLTVYNGGASGQNISYPVVNLARFNAMCPVTPDLLIINHAHNSSGASGGFYRGVHYQTLRALSEAFPRAGIVQLSQNARKSADSDFANHLSRCREIKTLSANLGMGIVDATLAFLAYPNYETALMADLVHPNDAGVALIASLFQQQMAASLQTPGASPYPAISRIWVPAPSMYISTGSPVLTTANRLPAWKMQNGFDMGVAALCEIPPAWERFGVYFMWTAAAEAEPSGQNTAAWRSASMSLTNLGRSIVNFEASISGNGGWTDNQAGPTTQSRPSTTGLGTWATNTLRIVADLTPLTPLHGIEIRRQGTHASDTLVNDSFLLGVLLERER